MFKPGKLHNFPSKFSIDGFIVAIGFAILLAWLWPVPGSREGWFSLKAFAHCGISVVFFFYGVGLSREKLLTHLGNLRLHILIQLSTFVVFPVIVLVAYSLFAGESDRELWLGTFYLAALPSTVSSSVVMVSLARGNVPAAIFNASLSSLLGIFITPVRMSLFLSTGNAEFSLANAILNLCFIVVLPIGLGMLFQPTRFGTRVSRHRKKITRFDQFVVLLIIHTSFCDSFTQNVFAGCTPLKLSVLCLLLIVLFFTVFGLISLASRVLKFHRDDRITALFCGSKKSLIHGTVMAKVLFHTNASLGMILLPLMLYHAVQLVIVSVIAQNMQKTDNDGDDNQH